MSSGFLGAQLLRPECLEPGLSSYQGPVETSYQASAVQDFITRVMLEKPEVPLPGTKVERATGEEAAFYS